MANPTTNYGWVMPTSASLVTNLPADFNTFGQGVDTSMQYLLGGTTGQVLSKTSGTNMAFTWVTPTDQTPLTTKGDLFTFTTVDARLAVGNNGEQLLADSSATTGLRYSATPSASNPVLNSAMQIAQRGTSISLAASAGQTYTLDRWCTQTNANQACTVSQELTGDTTNLPFIQYALRYKRNTSQTGTGGLTLLNAFETVNSRPFAGKPVTLSFYARAGALYSAASSALAVQLQSGTGTDQNPFTAYTGAATVASTTATLTTTWQRFTATGTVGATATELNVQAVFTPVGTAGATDYYEITGVQIDIGSVALPFRTYAATIQGELAACQRYFQVLGNLFGYAFSATQIQGSIASMPMRTTPTVALTTTTPAAESPIAVTARTGSSSTTAGSADLNQNSSQFIRINGFSGMTANTLSYVSSGQITLSAEL